MAAKPLSTEAIALTEKKMDMSLDDIIKMSKKNNANGKKPPRISNKSRGSTKPGAPQRSSKAQQYINSRVSVRQGALAQKRTNFQSNQFLLTTEVARKAHVAPIRSRGVSWQNQRVAAAPSGQTHPPESSAAKESSTKPRPQTLDALFANMKQQRMKAANQQLRRGGAATNPPQWRRQNIRGRGAGRQPASSAAR